jgi:hypothetical protein
MAADPLPDNAYTLLRGGGPIFPSAVWIGMTMREYFAGQALAAILSQPQAAQLSQVTDVAQLRSQLESISAVCYLAADAMLRMGEHRHE